MAEEEQTSIQQQIFDTKREIARTESKLANLQVDLEELETQVDIVDEVRESNRIVKR